MITRSEFDKIQFQSHGFQEPTREAVSHRLPPDSKPCNDLYLLRTTISNLVHEIKKLRTGTTMMDLISRDCDIPYATYKQYISGSGLPSRHFVAKLAVGLKLSVDQANELFRLHSGKLNLTNDADYVTHHALMDHDSIYDYEEDLEHYVEFQR